MIKKHDNKLHVGWLHPYRKQHRSHHLLLNISNMKWMKNITPSPGRWIFPNIKYVKYIKYHPLPWKVNIIKYMRYMKVQYLQIIYFPGSQMICPLSTCDNRHSKKILELISIFLSSLYQELDIPTCDTWSCDTSLNSVLSNPMKKKLLPYS